MVKALSLAGRYSAGSIPARGTKENMYYERYKEYTKDKAKTMERHLEDVNCVYRWVIGALFVAFLLVTIPMSWVAGSNYGQVEVMTKRIYDLERTNDKYEHIVDYRTR